MGCSANMPAPLSVLLLFLLVLVQHGQHLQPCSPGQGHPGQLPPGFRDKKPTGWGQNLCAGTRCVGDPGCLSSQEHHGAMGISWDFNVFGEKVRAAFPCMLQL